MAVKTFDSANEIADLLERQRPDVVLMEVTSQLLRPPAWSGRF